MALEDKGRRTSGSVPASGARHTGTGEIAVGKPTITSSGTVIRGNQDLANSQGYKDAIAEIQRIRRESQR